MRKTSPGTISSSPGPLQSGSLPPFQHPNDGARPLLGPAPAPGSPENTHDGRLVSCNSPRTTLYEPYREPTPTKTDNRGEKSHDPRPECVCSSSSAPYIGSLPDQFEVTMTHDPNNRPSSSPFKQAFREARVIALAAVAIAIVYNIFAATSIPWIREEHQTGTTPPLIIADSTESDTASPPVIINVDTAAPALGIDTSTVPAGMNQDSVKVKRDSVNQAKKMQAAQADSIRAAEEEMIFAKLATVSEIQTDVAKRLFDSKKRKVLFIDARPEDHFREGHIPGAMNVYAEQWQSQIPELVQISRDQVIVTYCGGGDECELSHDLAKNLKALGFKTVVVYMGGIKDWTAKKYPLVTQ